MTAGCLPGSCVNWEPDRCRIGTSILFASSLRAALPWRSLMHTPVLCRRLALCLCILSCVAANAGPVGIGWTPHGASTTAGYIAPDGKLILFDGGAMGWTPRPVAFPHVLVPGGPIVLLPQVAGDLWPTVITVSPANKLLQIVNGGIPQVLLPAQSFPVGAHLEMVQNGPQRLVMGVTRHG